MIIAIDGPAASGKGTIGKRLAAHYDLRHLDTGLLYRAVAKAVLDSGAKPDDTQAAIAAAKALSAALAPRDGFPAGFVVAEDGGGATRAGSPTAPGSFAGAGAGTLTANDPSICALPS